MKTVVPSAASSATRRSCGVLGSDAAAPAAPAAEAAHQPRLLTGPHSKQF
jgi:hypothetical protein